MNWIVDARKIFSAATLELRLFGHVKILALVIAWVLSTTTATAAVQSISEGYISGLSSTSETIVVRPIVEISGQSRHITMADLIADRGVSVELLEKLKTIRLADAPNPGESRIFTDVGLLEILRPTLSEFQESQHVTASEIETAIRLPTRVTVLRKPMQISSKEAESELRRHLKELCNDCRFEIVKLSFPEIPESIVGETVAWSLRPRNDMPKGAFSIPLELRNKKGQVRTYWISGHVAAYRDVPIASRVLSVGEKIFEQDFTIQSKEVTFATDAPATLNDFSGNIVSRPISAGQVIWRSNLRREIAVKAGDPIKVNVGGSGLQLIVEGVSQGNGYVGDLIRVKIPSTQKLVSGVLKEKGLIEVR